MFKLLSLPQIQRSYSRKQHETFPLQLSGQDTRIAITRHHLSCQLGFSCPLKHNQLARLIPHLVNEVYS